MEKEVNGFPYHSLSTKDALSKLSTTQQGLSEEEVSIRIKKYGPNVIQEEKKLSPVILLLKQFNGFFIYILIIAAVISYFLDHLIDMYVILAVIAIDASIGFFQEYKAKNAISALKKLIVPTAKVYRNNQLSRVPAENLVPGDIIFLEEGDRIPADARIIELKNLTTVEASLTGESLPSQKDSSSLNGDLALADRKNMVWMGTFIAIGSAKALVVGTGNNTAIGTIARDIKQIKEPKSHFQKKSDRLALQMGLIAIASSILIFLIGFFIRGFEFAEILLVTMASLVSAIPEGLPAILAIVLAVGAFRMAKRNAIIRRLPATETLAVVDTIITDKTGTLTQNIMAVQKIFLPGEEEITVEGNGWKPKGNFLQNKGQLVPLEDRQLSKLLHIASICSNARLVKDEGDGYKVIGDPTEAAIVVAAQKAGLNEESLASKEKKIDDMAFNTKLRLRSSISYIIKEKKKQLYVVGAPEVILKNSSKLLKLKTEKKLTNLEKSLILKQINSLTLKAMRVIAFAYKEIPDNIESVEENLFNDLTYVGVVGITDPPRPEAKDSIEKARKSGIRVIMATGDHKNTAIAIARDLGFAMKESKEYPVAYTGEELEVLSSTDFERAVKNVNIFARLNPHMKLKLAETLQKNGSIVAMTGDGVNDAPALKKADIGISMGIIGTDVARESSDIVLADDNFASIINAIEEGRIVLKNTRNTSYFLVTTNFAEAITIISTMAIGFPLPLLPTQILWLNLVTDTGSALGLALEPGHDGLAEEQPKNPKEEILTKEVIPLTLLMSLTMVFLTIFAFAFFFYYGSLEKARTASFIIMSTTQLFNALNMRDLKKSLFSIGFYSNKNLIKFLAISFVLILLVIYIPFTQSLFSFTYITPSELLILLFLSSSILWLGEGYKKLKK